MWKFFIAALPLFISFFYKSSVAQHHEHCGTVQYLQEEEEINPGTIEKWLNRIAIAREWSVNNQFILRTDYIIPVVVHVVYNTDEQNISDAEIFSQIQVLNEDFNRKNADSGKTPSVWKSIAGNIPVQFCLAQFDPDGNATNGIRRVNTASVIFEDESIKYSNQGGDDAWSPEHYLNIWVGNITTGILGYSFSDPNSPQDGVVISYKAFGRISPPSEQYNKGRTTSHEVGHWLGLFHTFDGGCGSFDDCDDTPPQFDSSLGCHSFPDFDLCSPDYPGIMFMNYMDYSDDECMNLFTGDQCDLMLGMLHTTREMLQNSPAGCQPIPFILDASLSTIQIPDDSVYQQAFRPEVQLTNCGSADLNYVKIYYRVDGQADSVFIYTGTLPSLTSEVVQLNSYFTSEGGHNFFAWTIEPNHGTDEFVFNDSLQSEFVIRSSVPENTTIAFTNVIGNQVSISLQNPGAPEMDWTLINIPGQVMMEGTWDVLSSSVLAIDLSAYPAGMYFFYGKIGYDEVKEKILLVR